MVGELELDRGLEQLLAAGRRSSGAAPSPRRSAVRRASAASVSVGFEVPIVGKLPEPTRNRLRCSQLRWSASTTEVARVVAHQVRAREVPHPVVVVARSSR